MRNNMQISILHQWLISEDIAIPLNIYKADVGGIGLLLGSR